MEATAYQAEAEQFLSSLTEEHFQHGAGIKEELEIVAIYERFAHLFEAGAVAALLEDRTTREARHLAHFAAEGLIDSILRDLTEHIATAETKATVGWDGASIPYRQAGIVMGNEPDAARRRDLQERIAAVTAELNPERSRRLSLSHGASAGLGFPDYDTMCDELCGLGLPGLHDSMQRLLTETEPAFRDSLHRHLEAAGVPPDEATTADYAFISRGQEFDRLFSKDDLVPSLKRTLAGLGMDLDSQANVTLDVEERPLKSPRAFCAPVRVPHDVRLVIRPHGGHVDYGALFHEAGHLQHFAFTRADAPFPYRCLGDNAITEAYAFLFGNLVVTPAWLREVLGVEGVGGYLALAKLGDRWYLRRYAAKLAYELELHQSDDVSRSPERYAEILGEAVQAGVRPENFLSDVDDFFYCACYLRAWILEVQLRGALVERFGPRWFASVEAGGFLRDLWGLGQEYTAEELAQRLGYRGLDVEPLIADLNAPPAD
jgi:hypothetical protein